jgi:hypothetical protein
VGDLEDRALGHVDEVARRRLVGVHARLDLVGGLEQAAQHRVLAHDARVLADVADRGHRAGQEVDAARPPTVSSSPACLRCSTSVSASTGSPSALRSSIAR